MEDFEVMIASHFITNQLPASYSKWVATCKFILMKMVSTKKVERVSVNITLRKIMSNKEIRHKKYKGNILGKT